MTKFDCLQVDTSIKKKWCIYLKKSVSLFKTQDGCWQKKTI